MKQVRAIDRRTVLRGVGTMAAAGLLAGCSDEGDGGGGGGSGDLPSGVSDYLNGANNFDGSASDETGSDSVTVMVGAGENNLAFDPAAIRVSTGTEVTWEWTGKGASHNVVAENGDFESELVNTEGHTFPHTFESTGNFNYYCNPHKASGMKGSVIVEESDG